MGRLYKKLPRKVVKTMPCNIIHTHQDVKTLAAMVERKLGADHITSRMKEEIWEEGYQEGFAEAVAATARILWCEWAKLNPKGTRLNVFFTRLKEVRKTLDKPDELQINSEQEFTRQTGIPLGRTSRC